MCSGLQQCSELLYQMCHVGTSIFSFLILVLCNGQNYFSLRSMKSFLSITLIVSNLFPIKYVDINCLSVFVS